MEIITISQVLLSKPKRNRDYGTRSPGLIREQLAEWQHNCYAHGKIVIIISELLLIDDLAIIIHCTPMHNVSCL